MSREDMKPSEIELKAYAKINLSLYVLSRRPDGYHDIKSLMIVFLQKLTYTYHQQIRIFH